MHIRSYCISGVSGILCRSFTHTQPWVDPVNWWLANIFCGFGGAVGHTRLHSTSLGLLKIIYLFTGGYTGFC